MGKTYILAHDLGTTGNKANLFDERGQLVASAFFGYETSYPQAGWAEQDADDWQRAVIETSKTLLAQSQIRPGEIAAISFSAQMMAGLPVDASGAPLRKAIIWADQRATEEAAFFTQTCGAETIYRRTGHRVSAAYSGPKMLWIKRHEPGLYARTRVFLQPKDYAAFCLTGQFATDYSDASGTHLFNLDRLEWDQEIMQAVGIAPTLLPPAFPSQRIIGQVTREASWLTGLAEGTPVVIGGGDGACATTGAGVVSEGDAYNYIGSSTWLSVASAKPLYDPQQRIVNFKHLDPALVCPMGTMQAAGGAYKWLSAWLRGAGEAENIYQMMDAWAAQTPAGAEGLLFLPYLMGERSPYWNPQARGAFVGLSMRHGPGHAARAAMEGVAFNLRLILEALVEQGVQVRAMRLIGGGAKSALWRQILADIYELPILRPQLLAEATSLGAAIAGGVGVGLWPSYRIAHELVQALPAEQPNPATQIVYRRLYPLFQEAYRALEPIFPRLA
jgi:xylulokinase